MSLLADLSISVISILQQVAPMPLDRSIPMSTLNTYSAGSRCHKKSPAMVSGMAFFDCDKNSPAGRANLAACAQASVNRRAIVP